MQELQFDRQVIGPFVNLLRDIEAEGPVEAGNIGTLVGLLEEMMAVIAGLIRRAEGGFDVAEEAPVLRLQPRQGKVV